MSQIFSIGQKVVALETRRSQPNFYTESIDKGRIYTVLGVMYCPLCGAQRINVTNETSDSAMAICGLCENEHIKTTPFRMSSSFRFAPLDNLHESIAEHEAKEDYETCAMLQKILDEQFQTV